MEHVLYYVQKVCNENKLESCKNVEDLMAARLPFNLVSAKMAQILREMSEEAREKGLMELSQILAALSREAEEAGVYDI